MYQLVVGIQLVSILVLLVETWVVFKNWKSSLHSWLFLGCASTLVNSCGYLYELLARSEDVYFTALRLSYLGRVWTVFCLSMFVSELVQKAVPRIIKIILALFCAATTLVVSTTRYTGLYYRNIRFYMNGDFPVFSYTNGIWHHIYFAHMLVLILVTFYFLIKALWREKNPISKKRLFFVLISILAETLFLLVEMFKLLPITRVYDVTMLSFPIGALFMLIAIFKYRLMDTERIARDYVNEELSECVIAVNEIGDIGYYNKAAIRLFPDLPLRPSKTIERLRHAIETAEPIKIHDRIYTPKESPLKQDGEDVGILYALVDDTEHFHYMEELEKQKAIADRANKAKSSFLANMSHEIRTPINAVLGMDEMILRESQEESTLAYAADIETAGRTLLSLINDILDFSKIEEGRMEILPTQYEVASLVNDLVNMIRDRAEKKGLKLDIHVDRDIPHLLYGDEIRIKQVALNLLTNAVKYTEKGKVCLEISFFYIGEDEIRLRFKISDTGIGMKEEDMEKLFSPFSRIEEERNRSIEGTGLGMSIVRQLLALMDSHLDVESVYGQGSTFSFAIRQRVMDVRPMGDVVGRFRERTGERKSYRELFHAPDARILVVDDTEVNLAVIRNLLKKTQIRIDTAASGQEALRLAGDHAYDVALIDHMMPDMDGIETLHRMREEHPEAKTIYIALTANAVSGAREMYLKAGFSDYLSKPVDGRVLEDKLKEILPEEKLLTPVDPGRGGMTKAPDTDGQTILVVDDDEVIIRTAGEILSKAYRVLSCQEGAEAVRIASIEQPGLILLDINLVGMTGFEVLEKLRQDATTREIPVMFITADEDRETEAQALKRGALDFVRKPFVPEVLLQRSRRIILLDRYQRDLKGEVLKQTGRAERLTREMMLALSQTVDAKDHYTNGHSGRVASYAAEIGRRMGKSFEEQKKLYEIGLLHDIGKIGVSEEIINKTQRLTEEEFGQIRKHTVIGYEILNRIADLPELKLGARSHHERYDGHGYPDGLAGDAIPEVARIICVADCYDAMTSTRTYSDPKPQDRVRAEVVRCGGSQFDPAIAEIMLAMIDDDSAFIMNERGRGERVWKGLEQYLAENGAETGALPTDPSGAAEPGEPNDAGEETLIPDWLGDVPGLDMNSGVTNCGSKESFLNVLTVFHQTAKHKADEIESLFDEMDLANYTIKVHALKSAARIIGAMGLSELAKKLEAAGKEGNETFIRENTGELLEQYRSLDAGLRALDGDGEDRKELSDKQRTEAFQTIGEIAGSMDYGMMEGMLRDLRAYRLKPADETALQKMEERLMELDWDGIEALSQAALDG